MIAAPCRGQEQEVPMEKYSWFQIAASVFGFLVVAPLLLPGLLLFAVVNAPIFLWMLVPVLTISASKGE
jgi:hypothetical protein